jgi:hypothetical protein
VRSIVTVTVPATSTMLCTVADLKTELGGIETDDNSRFFRLIRAASQKVVAYLHRPLALETVSEAFRREHGDRRADCLNLSRYPIIVVTSVTEDGVALTTADYEVDPARGQLFRLSNDCRTCWTAAKIVVVYQAGYKLPGVSDATLPADIEEAALRLASQSYTSPEQAPGLRSIIVPGVVEKQFWDQSASGEDGDELPPDIRALLDPYLQVIA